MTKYVEVSDNHYIFRISSILVYTIFINIAYQAFIPGMIPVIPNLLLLTSCIVLIYLYTFSSRFLSEQSYSTRNLWIRFLLGVNPFLLGGVISFRLSQKLRRSKEDPSIYYGLLLISIVSYFLAIVFFIFVSLAFIFDPIPYHPFYLLSVGLWGGVGFLLGDLSYGKIVEKDNLSNGKITFPRRIKATVYSVLISVNSNRTKRIGSQIIGLLLVLLVTIFANPSSFGPMSINYQIDNAERIGDPILIFNVENAANNFSGLGPNMIDYNIDEPPIVISGIILTEYRSQTKKRFGNYQYIAAATEPTLSINQILASEGDFWSLVVGKLNKSDVTLVSLLNTSKMVHQQLHNPFQSEEYISNTVLIDQFDNPFLWIVEVNGWN